MNSLNMGTADAMIAYHDQVRSIEYFRWTLIAVPTDTPSMRIPASERAAGVRGKPGRAIRAQVKDSWLFGRIRVVIVAQLFNF